MLNCEERVKRLQLTTLEEKTSSKSLKHLKLYRGGGLLPQQFFGFSEPRKSLVVLQGCKKIKTLEKFKNNYLGARVVFLLNKLDKDAIHADVVDQFKIKLLVVNMDIGN